MGCARSEPNGPRPTEDRDTGVLDGDGGVLGDADIVLEDPDGGADATVPGPTFPIPNTFRVCETITPSGGRIEAPGVAFLFPRGALDGPTELCIVASPAEGPFPAWTPQFHIEPRVPLRAPVKLRVDRVRGFALSAFQRRLGTDTYVAREIQERSDGHLALMETTEPIYLGTACAGCSQAYRRIRLSVALEQGREMAHPRRQVQELLPVLAKALYEGDANDDGVQDFPAADFISFEVTSTSADIGDGDITECADVDNGQLLPSSCNGARHQHFTAPARPEEAEALLGVFADDLRCAAVSEGHSCSIAQPLEALLRATTPEHSSITFPEGEGLGTFLNNTAELLLVVGRTDDCSAQDLQVFRSDSPRFEGPARSRCQDNPDALMPLSRYSWGFAHYHAMSLRRPAFVFIAGIPVGADSASTTRLLEHPSMQDRFSDGERPEPACAGTVSASPARRLVGLAGEFEAEGQPTAYGSICRESYLPLVPRFAEAAGRALGGF